jgi:O-antigen/teichoic acid export membrane protein
MFWRGVFGYLPVQVISAIVGFGTLVVFTRLLSPEQLGQYALAFSVGVLVQTAFLIWSEAATARFHVAETERGDPRTAMATLQRANLTLSVTGIAITGVVLLFLHLDPALELAILGAVTASAGRGFFKLRQERNRAEGDVKSYALIEITYVGGGFLLGALLAWLGFGAPGVFAGTGIAVVLILSWIMWGEFRLSAGGRFDPERLRRYLSYGMPITAWLILTLALSSTDRFIIAAFLDEAHVGAYHAGYSVGLRVLDVAFAWLGMAGGPAMVAALERGGRPALERVAHDQATLMVRLLLPATVGVVLVSGPLTHLLVGEALRVEAARITPWIAASAFFSGFATHYLGHAFTLGKRTGLYMVVMTLPAAANLGLNLVLIPRFGIVGAAWATLASFVLCAAVSWLAGRRVLKLPIPWRTVARTSLASGLMAAVVLTLPVTGGVGELALKSAVGALVYGLAMFLLDPELRRRALGLVGGAAARKPA